MNDRRFNDVWLIALCAPWAVVGLSAIACDATDSLEREKYSPGSKPSILVILSDDQGYHDVGFQGCKDIPTPHLDRLASDGLRCTAGYVTHSFCSPSRAAILTGRYQQRFGHETNPAFDANDHIEGLPTSEKLLPEFLRPVGYATGWIGKWHLGAAPAFHPLRRGFTETFGFIGGGHRYRNWNVHPDYEYLVPIERNGQPVEVTDHLTVALGREAAAFIRRHKAEPWFLYLAFNAPHLPHEPTPDRLALFASIANPTRRAYAAQVSLMDDAIGDALSALRETGQTNRTLVFFFSDNGGPVLQRSNGSSNAPLRSGKGSVYEGGARVPFVVSWPGTLPSGKTYHQPVSSLDVFATALDCAGAPMPTDRTYDGVNLLPYLRGDKTGTPHDRLFWRWLQSGRWAMRQGNWKLVCEEGRSDELYAREEKSKLRRPEAEVSKLYDLAADIGESKDLSASHPETKAKLDAALNAWDKELVPPAFPGATVKRPAKPAAKQANPSGDASKARSERSRR